MKVYRVHVSPSLSPPVRVFEGVLIEVGGARRVAVSYRPGSMKWETPDHWKPTLTEAAEHAKATAACRLQDDLDRAVAELDKLIGGPTLAVAR